MTNKLCPLLMAGNSVKAVYCDRGECAWWDEVDEQCAIISIGDAASDFMDVVEREAHLRMKDEPVQRDEYSEEKTYLPNRRYKNGL